MSLDRRDFIKRFSGSLLSLMAVPYLAKNGFAGHRGHQDKRMVYDWRTPKRNKSQYKNVVLLFFDDLRHDTFSFLGSPVQTPNIDSLKKESVYFQNACTTTGLCSPSRAALFTGRLGHRTGLDDNCHVWHSQLMGLSLNEETILEWARRKDYFLGYFGKWHLGPNGLPRRGVHRFLTHNLESENIRKLPEKPDFESIKRYYDKSKTFDEKPEYYATLKGSYEDTPAYQKTEAAIKFLDEAKNMEMPFFLTVSYNSPHPPYRVPAPYNRMYDYRKVKLPKSLNEDRKNKPAYQHDVLWPWHDVGHMTEDDWKKCTAYYWGSVTMIDRAVGQILDTLKKNGFWENTLIVFLGDQGSMIGEHGLYDKGPYSYDELMRIPLLIRVPGVESKTVTRQVSSIDVNKTLTDWMGLDVGDKNLDSRSLMPLITKGDSGWDGPDEVFYRYEWYNGNWYGIRTIRTPEYKYCWNPVDVNELYDLKNDPEEMHNLIHSREHRKIKEELEQRLLAHLKAVDDPLYKKMKYSISN